jgi:hypothetical protein
MDGLAVPIRECLFRRRVGPLILYIILVAVFVLAIDWIAERSNRKEQGW